MKNGKLNDIKQKIHKKHKLINRFFKLCFIFWPAQIDKQIDIHMHRLDRQVEKINR